MRTGEFWPGRRPFPGDQFGLKRRYEGLQQSGLLAFVLEQGIKGGHQLGLAAIPAGDVAVRRPIAKSHGASAHRHLAETKYLPLPPAWPRTMTRPESACRWRCDTRLVRAGPAPRGARGRHVRAGAAHRLPHRPRNQVQRQLGRAGPCAEPPRPRTTTRPTTKLAAELLGLTAAARVRCWRCWANADGVPLWYRACTCLRHCFPVSRSAWPASRPLRTCRGSIAFPIAGVS